MKSIRIIINSINNYRRADCELCCVIIYEGMSHWFFNTFRDIYLSEIRWLKYITGAFPLVMPNTHTNNDGEWEMKEQRCKEKTVGVDLFRVIRQKNIHICCYPVRSYLPRMSPDDCRNERSMCVCVREKQKGRDVVQGMFTSYLCLCGWWFISVHNTKM